MSLATFFGMYLTSLKLKSCTSLYSYCLRLFDIIWQGHISGPVGVLHARRTTLALFFSSYLP